MTRSRRSHSLRVAISALCAAILCLGFIAQGAGRAAATESPTDRFALIVEGYEPYDQTRLGWFWGATSGMYDILRDDYAIPRENIHFLFQDTRGGDPRITAISTKANILAALDDLQTRMEEDDQLYCYFVDHGYSSGGHSYFSLQGGQTLSDTELDTEADAIAAINQTWVFTQCQSGGFASAMAAAGRIISTSTRIDENNAAAFAEPFRDGLNFDGGTPPTVAAAYDAALDRMWTDYRTGSFASYAFNEHCLINDFGTGGGRYGKYLQYSNYVGPDTPSGQSFQLRNFIVSVYSQQVNVGSDVKVRFEFYNPTASPITFNTICVGCRDPGMNNRDFGHANNVTLAAYDSYLFEADTAVNAAGTWLFWPAFNIGGFWGPYRWHESALNVPRWVAARDAFIRRLGDRFGFKAGPYYSSSDPQLQLTNFGVYGPILGDTGFARPHDTVTVRFTFKNTGATPMTFDPYGILVGCRDPQGYNRDFGHHTETLAAGASLTREATIVVDKAGQWIFWPAYYYGHWGPYQWQALTINVYERTWVDNGISPAYYTVGTTANTSFGPATVLAAAYGFAVAQTSDSKYVWEGMAPLTGGYYRVKCDTLAGVRSLINGATDTMAPGVRRWWLDIGLPNIGG